MGDYKITLSQREDYKTYSFTKVWYYKITPFPKVGKYKTPPFSKGD